MYPQPFWYRAIKKVGTCVKRDGREGRGGRRRERLLRNPFSFRATEWIRREAFGAYCLTPEKEAKTGTMLRHADV